MLLVPLCPPPSFAVMVRVTPPGVIVTLSVLTPEVKLPEVAGLILPPDALSVTVLAKLVTVLLLVSCAVIVILNAAPAVCGLDIFAIAK